MTTPERSPAISAGYVAPEIAAEHPGLRLRHVTVAPGPRADRAEARRRLRELSDRRRGAEAVAMRAKPIAHAYRAFFRQVGLDPDVHRVPSEQAMVERLLIGGLPSRSPIADACLVALVETGVPVWALDASVVGPSGLGIRCVTAVDVAADVRAGRRGGPPVAIGELVVADSATVHASLFTDPPAARCAGARTASAILFAIGVEGVGEIQIDEALWCALELV